MGKVKAESKSLRSSDGHERRKESGMRYGCRRMQRPRHPHTDFDLFCVVNGRRVDCFYPCLACRGRGWVAENLLHLSVCPVCGGSGEGTEEACRTAYIDAIEQYEDRYEEAYEENYNEEIDKFDLYIELWRQAVKKLTREEIKAIRKLGIRESSVLTAKKG